MNSKIKSIRTDINDNLLNETEFEIHLKTKRKILILEGSSDLNFFKILLDKAKTNITPFCINGNDSKRQLIALFTNYPEIQNNPLFLGVIDKDQKTLLLQFGVTL
ncbi:hypothetical protein [Paenibacillus sp. Marseille-Q7038]